MVMAWACARRALCRWRRHRVKDAGAVGLEPTHGDTGGHLESLGDFARLRIDAAELALLGLHGAVPELAVHPGDAGDEAIRFDRAQNSAFLRVDLVDLAGAGLSNPERPLGQVRPESRPCEGAGMVATTWPERGSTFWIRSSMGGASTTTAERRSGQARCRAELPRCGHAGVERVGAIAAYSQRRREAL